MERAVLSGNFVIGILAVPHAEAIVMLRRKYQIADSCFSSGFRPLFRIEADGIKGFVQPKYCSLKLLPSASQSMPVLDHPASASESAQDSTTPSWNMVPSASSAQASDPGTIPASPAPWDPWAGHSPPRRCNYVLPVQFSPPALLHFPLPRCQGFPLSIHLLSAIFHHILSHYSSPLLHVPDYK